MKALVEGIRRVNTVAVRTTSQEGGPVANNFFTRLFKTRAAVSIISGMRLMYWSDGCLGRENRFYSIGVFLVLVVVSLLLLLLGIFLT